MSRCSCGLSDIQNSSLSEKLAAALRTCDDALNTAAFLQAENTRLREENLRLSHLGCAQAKKITGLLNALLEKEKRFGDAKRVIDELQFQLSRRDTRHQPGFSFGNNLRPR